MYLDNVPILEQLVIPPIQMQHIGVVQLVINKDKRPIL
jgi:hypothetical protein